MDFGDRGEVQYLTMLVPLNPTDWIHNNCTLTFHFRCWKHTHLDKPYKEIHIFLRWSLGVNIAKYHTFWQSCFINLPIATVKNPHILRSGVFWDSSARATHELVTGSRKAGIFKSAFLVGFAYPCETTYNIFWSWLRFIFFLRLKLYFGGSSPTSHG